MVFLESFGEETTMEAKRITWETSWEKALERARQEGKLVLLDFFNPG